MVLNSKKLAELLGISSKTLRNLKCDGLLKERLQAIGYNLVEEFKEGRAVYYRLDDCKPTDEVALFNKEVFNTEHDGFKHYYMERTSTSKGQDTTVDDVVTKKDLGKIANADPHTISRWDDKLEELGIIAKDGVIYLRFTNLKVFKASQEEFRSYQRRVRMAKEEHSAMMLAYRRNDISKDTAEIAQEKYKEELKGFADDYVIKLPIYKLNKNNPIHVEAVKLYTTNN